LFQGKKAKRKQEKENQCSVRILDWFKIQNGEKIETHIGGYRFLADGKRCTAGIYTGVQKKKKSQMVRRDVQSALKGKSRGEPFPKRMLVIDSIPFGAAAAVRAKRERGRLSIGN